MGHADKLIDNLHPGEILEFPRHELKSSASDSPNRPLAVTTMKFGDLRTCWTFKIFNLDESEKCIKDIKLIIHLSMKIYQFLK